jgi:hypothetical protein
VAGSAGFVDEPLPVPHSSAAPRYLPTVAELAAARVDKSDGRISAKRSLLIVRSAGYGHSAGAAAGSAPSLP